MGGTKDSRRSDRTSGSFERVPFDVATGWIDAHTRPLEAEPAGVADAAGRILAEPVAATADMPPSDRAALGGIALRAEDTLGASTYNPLTFRAAPAGAALPPFGAMRVDAGDALPGDADAVVLPEHAAADGPGGFEIIEPVATGSWVERAGSHAARGAMLLYAGRRLEPYDIGLLASAGLAEIPVIRQPKLRVVATNRDPAEQGAVGDTESPLLHALIARDGGIVTDLYRIGRDGGRLRDMLAAPGPDIVLVVGGTGQGSRDDAATVLAEAGELAIHSIAVCPGEDTGIGLVGADVPVFLLPVAPAAACLWAYELFAGRAIRRLAGREAMPFRAKEVVTCRKIVSAIGVTEVCPVRYVDDGTVEPIASFGEAGLVAAAQADGFVVVPEGSEGFSAGAALPVYLKDGARGWADPDAGSGARR